MCRPMFFGFVFHKHRHSSYQRWRCMEERLPAESDGSGGACRGRGSGSTSRSRGELERRTCNGDGRQTSMWAVVSGGFPALVGSLAYCFLPASIKKMYFFFCRTYYLQICCWKHKQLPSTKVGCNIFSSSIPVALSSVLIPTWNKQGRDHFVTSRFLTLKSSRFQAQKKCTKCQADKKLLVRWVPRYCEVLPERIQIVLPSAFFSLSDSNR